MYALALSATSNDHAWKRVVGSSRVSIVCIGEKWKNPVTMVVKLHNAIDLAAAGGLLGQIGTSPLRTFAHSHNLAYFGNFLFFFFTF